MNQVRKDDPNNKTVAENRKARFSYEVLDTVEVGLVLTGTEVKSLRQGQANIQEAYASLEGGEFWLVMLGKIRYNIEGLPEFEAGEGDVVYVPRQTWHLASFGGQEGLRSCRLAMNGFPYQAHMFEQD